MPNETAQHLSELRNLARHNIEQINRAAVGLLEVMRNFTKALVAPSNPGNAVAIELVRGRSTQPGQMLAPLRPRTEACAGKFAG